MDEQNADGDRRSKRQKCDKGGRFAALTRLKNLKEKGVKNKYEVENVENVFDTIDETEYSKRVIDRQNDDWIVDGGAYGYVEDGRDIFDDDLDSQSIANAQKEQKRGKKRKKGLADNNTSKGNLQYMLSNIQTKKKKEDEKLGADDDLSDLISELNETPSTTQTTPNTSSFLSEKVAAKSYMNSFTTTRPSLKIHKAHSKAIKLARDSNVHHESENTEDDKVHETDLKDNMLVMERVDLKEQDDEILENVKAKTAAKVTSGFDNGGIDNCDINDLDEAEISQMFMDDDDLDVTGNTLQSIDGKTDVNESRHVQDTEMLEKLENGWETMLETYATSTEPLKESSDKPLINNEDDKDKFLFYWWDAYENKTARAGVVLLFGKTYSEEEKSYVSCCVVVQNIERQIYLLPKTHSAKTNEPVTIMDIYNEFNDHYAKKLRMDTFKSRKVKRKYAFDANVPTESDYLEIRYSTKYPALAEDTSGSTFSKVFGTTTNFLELLLLDRKIKGPCWLSIANVEQSNGPISWCKLEMICTNSSDVTVIKDTRNIPPLTVMAINTKNIVNLKAKSNEIVMITCLTQSKFYVNRQSPNPPFEKHFCVMRPLPNQLLPSNFYQSMQNYKGTTVQKLESERALFNYLLMQISTVDPDIIVGHDLLGNQMNLMADRLLQSNIKDVSKFGRVKKYYNKNNTQELTKLLFCGRLVCDLKVSLKELIRSRSYDLDTLCNVVLKLRNGQRIDIDPEDLTRIYENSIDILNLISCTMQDTAFILKMMYEMNVIPLALQITNIAGNVLSRTLLGGRSERNEFLLLHAFHEKDYIVPSKTKSTNESVSKAEKKKGANYLGGLVLDPKIGFYDKMILLMDFNSLYPSIIQEYNICFTTQNLLNNNDKKDVPQQGILPTEIRKLVESRREVKKLMNAPDISNDLKMQYNIRQMALKLTANSMYGCLGFSNSRFYAKHLAEYVTQMGRDILTNTRDLVQNMSYEVIYGDTDSIMINTKSTDHDAVMRIGHKIKQEINKLYKQVELDIDGVFKYLLLLRKKKYAAVTLTKSLNGELVTNHEYKGLDFVRRDWCSLTAEAGKCILNNILSDLDHDEKLDLIKTHLEKLREDFDNRVVPLPLLIITKQLAKDPNKYGDVNSLPHVRVALRYNKKNSGKTLRGGDTVPYVICVDGTNSSANHRAYHVEEYKKSDMKLDSEYYLAHQIHPVIMRLCEPIEGIDSYEIATSLGIEHTFKKPQENANIRNEINFNAPEIVFRGADPFKFLCRSCKEVNAVDRIRNPPFLTKCSNNKCDARPANYVNLIKNDLTLFLRRYTNKLYNTKYICEDPSCTYESRRLSYTIIKGHPICDGCNENNMYKKYTGKDMYVQIQFLRHVFDVNNYENVNSMDQTIISAFQSLVKYVNNWSSVSAYSKVNLGSIFNKIYYGKDTDGDDDCYWFNKNDVDVDNEEIEFDTEID